jgi:hypothetical protein
MILHRLGDKTKPLSKAFRVWSSMYFSIISVLLILIISIPNLLNVLMSSVQGRADVVRLFFKNLDGPQIFLGFGHSFGMHIYSWSFMSGRYVIVDNIHNAFFTVLGQGGILYLAFYVGLIIYAFYLLVERRNNLLYFVISGSVLVSFLFSSLFESTQLFISGSSGSVLMSLMIVSLPLSIAKEERKTHDFYELKIGENV